MTISNYKRPKYLNLFKIWMPVAAIKSILHRLSGVILFLTIPILIYVLQLSLISESGFNEIAAGLSHVVVKLILLAIIWATLHHLLTGIRFLMIDFDIGVSKAAAGMSAWFVSLAAFGLVLLVAWEMLL